MMHMGKEMTLQAKDHLLDWYMANPVYALMGEYSSGKSTLLNLLLDTDALPTKVTATNLPPVWLTYGETNSCVGLRHDGSLEDVDLSNTDEDVRENYVVLRMALPSERLKTTDIIDTPGISDPKLEKGALAFLGDYVDFVVWLSAANQAWRQTEKMAWTAFPETLRDTSILVLTRADKMRNATDLGKVVKRCTTETADLFRDIIPLQTKKAAAVPHGERTNDDESLWVTTGAAAVDAALATSLTEAHDARENGRLALAQSKSKAAKLRHDAPAHVIKTAEPAAAKPTTSTCNTPKEYNMSTDISALSDIGGFIGGCLVDSETGLMMASEGGDDTLDLEAAGAANTEVLKAKMAAIEMLGLDEQIDEILMTLGGQFHLIRPLADTPTVFIYTALDKATANLGMARVQVKNVEASVSL